jgi:hypothetical protein
VMSRSEIGLLEPADTTYVQPFWGELAISVLTY